MNYFERKFLGLAGVVAWFLWALCLWTGCSDSTSGNDVPSGNGGENGGSVECDDGKSCTIDAVVKGSCTHSVGPNSGDTACPDSQFCTLKGCIAAPTCATKADCEKAWANDVCKTQPVCDAASSVCLFSPLDKDKDGHAPLVCGGDDCDDSTASRAPGFEETCDGVDNDCDGVVDNQATCANALEQCMDGVCTCDAEHTCGSGCYELSNDRQHCGSCDTECPDGATCTDGECTTCTDGTDLCADANACFDLSSDRRHCGDCDNSCPTGATCVAGFCACANEQTMCDGECIDVSIDLDNCGACGSACTNQGEHCLAGTCACTKKGAAACDGVCIDVASDELNCGTCGVQCDGGTTCIGGSCKCDGSQMDCAGTCVDVAHDVTNCGACGTACGVGESCEEGVCFDPHPRWPMPNPPSTGLPNPQSYDTSTSGVVTDNVTGLMWQRAVSAASYYWDDAHAYCADLALAGKADWRVPSRIELVSLIDFTRSNPSIDPTAFPSTPSAEFWTTSPSAGTAQYAWTVNFTTGDVKPFGNHRDVPTDALRVRCVRVAKPGSTAAYVLGDGTAYDPRTKLTWQTAWDDWSWEASFYWNTVSQHCTDLSLGGTGWRVPSVKELQTIVDETIAAPAIDTVTFPSTPAYIFWTSSATVGQAGSVWTVSFEKGWTGNEPTTNARALRCVR